jgi:hypothetical protein
MHTPKFSTKRVLGLGLATALAVSSLVGLAASSSQAVTVTNPAASLSPKTGAVAGGTTVTVKGKGFADSTGAVVVAAVSFETSPCTVDASSLANAVTSYNVVSATKMVMTTPALSAGDYYLCVWDAATASANILGQGTFTAAPGPTASTLTPATSNVATASQLGGTVVSLAGTAFDKSTKASIDNVAAKTTYVSATKLSIVLPAHAVGTGFKISLTSTYGTATSTDTVSFVRAIASVTPAFGNGTIGDVITVTGTGFRGRNFSSTPALGVSEIALVKGGTALAVAGTVPTTNLCGSVQVESDTVLSCSLTAAVTDGPYSVVIVDEGTAGTAIASLTAISKSSTYSISDF